MKIITPNGAQFLIFPEGRVLQGLTEGEVEYLNRNAKVSPQDLIQEADFIRHHVNSRVRASCSAKLAWVAHPFKEF